MYRIRKVTHHRTGDDWCIYPMYDYAHPMSDAFEGITHSVCTLEFAHHNPLYQWFVSHFDFDPMPWQYEFARLNLTYTVMSKRLLKRLVEEERVSGWDDPRMPTVAGMRRRGYTPAAIRRFAERIGVSRRDSVVDVGLLEHALREDLNATSPRTMAVLRPLKLVIENFPEDEEVELVAPFSPNDESFGSRTLHLTREVFIERDDFMEEPMKKWFRLAHLQRSRQGRRGQGRRAPLYLGPGVQRRQRARRPQSPRDHPLGQRKARRRRRGAPLRPPLQR
jgi:glutaminyl-tRNA synthetase